MRVEDYLKKYQPIIHRTFANALTSDSLSHAYLITGNSGTPLLEVAIYLAKSLLCEEAHPFACENCMTCTRVNDGNYPDFVILDGNKGTIKKEMILNLESSFDRTAFESKGKKIYVLNLIETISDSTINAILKFLEEPGKEIYAFLTTNNISNVLPTIVSRCQTLSLKPIDRLEIINKALELGVEKEDAELLSYFYNDENLLSKAYVEDKNYKLAKEAFLDLTIGFTEDINEAIFRSQTKVAPLLNSKESARFFFDMLISFFEDIESYKHSNHIFLTSLSDRIEKLAANLHKSDEILIEILKARSQISLNINIALLLDHIMFTIRKES